MAKLTTGHEEKMKAAVCTKYGPPEVIKIMEVEKPVPKDNEVLIKVVATTCHIGDVRVRSFDVPLWQMIPFRLFLGIFKPKRNILGMELAGIVEAVGKDVKRFKVGDEVFATSGFQFGGQAEYICIPEDSKNVMKGLIALKPENMTFEQAAAGVSTGGLTALQVIRKCDIEDKKVLIYGASGSVGTYAVQLAVHFGGKVTGVCSTANLDMVRDLGAQNVLDYTKDEILESTEVYDVIFDAVGKMPAHLRKKFLKKGGLFLDINKDSGSGKGIGTKDLIFLKELVEKGVLKTVIDRTYPLDQIVEANIYVEKGHKKGHVVIEVAKIS